MAVIQGMKITPEMFLRACSDEELKETLLLLNLKKYAIRIHLEDSVTEVEYQLIDVVKEVNNDKTRTGEEMAIHNLPGK